ncbi:MAG: hypothetical protein RMJ43_16030 [Chloroherpetonaceae bacterium]|nr:hypothetical protein [Chthonomonadaceae bacterium]MDW8209343.1 hypothetical protein [Chloroherpetonaceae bacterium]
MRGISPRNVVYRALACAVICVLFTGLCGMRSYREDRWQAPGIHRVVDGQETHGKGGKGRIFRVADGQETHGKTGKGLV